MTGMNSVEIQFGFEKHSGRLMELTSYLTKLTHSTKWVVSLIKIFRLIVHADVKVDSGTLSPGYFLLNEMTNGKSF